jgi:hypothetical protein
MKKISSRLGFGLSVLALSVCLSSLALAEAPRDSQQCSGERTGKRAEGGPAEHAAERFKRADKNSDGFLTQAEVGDRRWSRIQVADSDKDGKVSQAEFAEAYKEGKLGHHGHDKHPA